jgi:hypothetical protein
LISQASTLRPVTNEGGLFFKVQNYGVRRAQSYTSPRAISNTHLEVLDNQLLRKLNSYNKLSLSSTEANPFPSNTTNVRSLASDLLEKERFSSGRGKSSILNNLSHLSLLYPNISRTPAENAEMMKYLYPALRTYNITQNNTNLAAPTGLLEKAFTNLVSLATPVKTSTLIPLEERVATKLALTSPDNNFVALGQSPQHYSLNEATKSSSNRQESFGSSRLEQPSSTNLLTTFNKNLEPAINTDSTYFNTLNTLT